MPVEAGYEVREFRLRGAEVTEEGTFSGYASTFGNADSYGDVIERGAFAKTLRDQPVRPLLWCHTPQEVIGIAELTEDSKGLRLRGKLELEVARAREVHALMRAGAVRGLSIGFFPRQAESRGEGRVLREIELVEVSLTPFPANPRALVENVRTQPAHAAKREELSEMELKQIESKFDEFGAKLAELGEKFADTRKQVDLIDGRLQAAGTASGGGAGFAERFVREFTDKKSTFESGGRLRFTLAHPLLERREILRPGDLPASGEARIGAAAGEPAGALLDLIPRRAISGPAAYVLREDSSAGWVASPQVEAQAKYESNASFDGTLVPVRTIATWVAVSRQALDDIEGLGDFINARLRWALLRKLEEQILLGNGAGENLEGLMPSAQTWTPPFGGNWDLYGQLAFAATQVELAGFRPTAVIVHPADYRTITLQRDENRQYVQPPAGIPRLVASAAIGSGQFLIGDFSQCVLRVRQDVAIDISTEHSDFFTKNKVAIRCEQRVALVTYSPSAFVKGALASSPA